MFVAAVKLESFDSEAKMARSVGALLKLIQITYLLTFFHNEMYKDGTTKFNPNGYGKAAKLSCGRELSSDKITYSRPTVNRVDDTVVSPQVQATAMLGLSEDLRFVNVRMLCGDIALNPGPVSINQGFKRDSLNVCHWNIQRLT